MKRFSELYLGDVIENQGNLFGLVTEIYPDKDTVDFIEVYMKSRTRLLLDEGEVVLLNMAADDLLDFFLKTEGYQFKDGEGIRGFMPIWVGEFYAQYQWEKGMPSAKVIEKVPFAYLRKVYDALHDLDLEEAIERVD